MKIENRQKFLIVLTIVVVGLWLGDLLVFEPLGKWWTTRSHNIVELRKQVKDGKFLVRREDDIRGHWDEMRTNTLPNNTSQAEQQVLKAFDNWSQESGAAVTSIMPQWKNDTDDYMTLNCRVEASGDLGALTRFVYDIEKSPTALKLESVQFSTHDNTGEQLTLELQISGLALTSTKK